MPRENAKRKYFVCENPGSLICAQVITITDTCIKSLELSLLKSILAIRKRYALMDIERIILTANKR